MKVPSWADALIIKAIKEFVKPESVAELFDTFKAELFLRLKEMAAKTENQLDDALIERLEQALNECDIDSNMLCELIGKGEDALISFLREQVAKTPSKIDDALIDILEDAIKNH